MKGEVGVIGVEYDVELVFVCVGFGEMDGCLCIMFGDL